MSHYRSYPTHAALLQNKPSSVSGEAPAEVLATATAAADLVISSGAVSRRSNCDHRITISGHSNPDHEPTPGSADDSLVISITQIDAIVSKPAEVAAQADGESNG